MDDEGFDIGAVAWGNAKPPADKEAVSAVLEKEKLVKCAMASLMWLGDPTDMVCSDAGIS